MMGLLSPLPKNSASVTFTLSKTALITGVVVVVVVVGRARRFDPIPAATTGGDRAGRGMTVIGSLL